MKKYLFLMLLPMVIGLASCDYHDRMMEVGDLPTRSTEFISTYFPECEIVAIDKDRDINGVTYDVVLNCGVKLEFKSSGEWREVDCEPDAVPVLIIPEKILQFVNNKYPDSYVVSIERKLTRYLVDLNNDLELVFDDEGNFKRIDD
ncbi:MAG: PepSY-like domain-containing protein [Paludibacteraceae bacterium]|nr:PepSY-like domain-containing protein [Paludibacteraceae bacterium]